MSHRFILPGALCVVLALTGCAVAPSDPAPSDPEVARTVLPGLNTPTGEPTLPALASARPSRGRVLIVEGPFSDRLRFERPSFDGKVVRGELEVVSDVSHLIDLQVQAGFHDASGQLLAVASFTRHGEAEAGAGQGHAAHPGERVAFEIPVPAPFAGRAVSASVGVPVLVNE